MSTSSLFGTGAESGKGTAHIGKQRITGCVGLLHRIRNRLLREKEWCIAFVDNTLEDVLAGKPLKTVPLRHDCKGRWFADPFILRTDENEIVLLVEDYDTKQKKGRISKLTIARQGYRLLRVDILLDLPHHLSFPHIIQRDGEVLFMPEALRSKGLTIYRLDEKNNVCEEVETLTQVQLSDAIFAHFIEEECILATEYPDDGNKLRVFRRDENGRFGIWQSFDFPDGTARNAGDFFQFDNQLYRPAQDCGIYYGHGVVLQSIDERGDEVRFQEVRKLYSANRRFSSRLHTFNVYQDTIVVDMADWNFPYIAKGILWMEKVLRGKVKKKDKLTR